MFTPRMLLISFAAFILITLLPALIHPRKFIKAAKSMLETTTLRIFGLFSLLYALLFLSVQWKFSSDFIVIIAILGWLLVIRGIMLIWFPDFIKKNAKNLIKSEKTIAVLAFISLLIAIALIYIAIKLIGSYEIVSA